MPTKRRRNLRKSRKRGGNNQNYATNYENCYKNPLRPINEVMCRHSAYKYDFPGKLNTMVGKSVKRLDFDTSKRFYMDQKEKSDVYDEQQYKKFYESIPENPTINDILDERMNDEFKYIPPQPTPQVTVTPTPKPKSFFGF
jgi:hypothetical protein